QPQPGAVTAGAGCGWQTYPAGEGARVSGWVWGGRPIWGRVFWDWTRAGGSRTLCTAGTKRPMRVGGMASTTSKPISVKAVRPRAAVWWEEVMEGPQQPGGMRRLLIGSRCSDTETQSQ